MTPNYFAIAGYCIMAAAVLTLLAIGWRIASTPRSDDVAPGADVSSSLPELAARRRQQDQEKTANGQLESRSTRGATVRP